MTSEKQIKANRRNARKSTGPKTPEGKAIVRFNALKHGLRSENALLLPGEDGSALGQLREHICADLMPMGELENLLVDQVVACIWKLRRLNLIEDGVLAWQYYGIQAERREREARSYEKSGLDFLMGDIEITDERKREEALQLAREAREIQESEIPTVGLAFIKSQDTFSRLTRYQTMLERSLYRAIHELKELQAERKSDEDSAIDMSEDMA